MRREKSTVTRCFLADWPLSSSSSSSWPALRRTQAECLLSSFSLYTRRHVRVKGEVRQVMTHPTLRCTHLYTQRLRTAMSMPATETRDEMTKLVPRKMCPMFLRARNTSLNGSHVYSSLLHVLAYTLK